MGSACSTAEVEATGPLEALLVLAVKSAKTRNGLSERKMHTFNSLLMQFGKMRPGFLRMKDLFHSLANSTSMRIGNLENKLDLLKIDPNSEIMGRIIKATRAEGKGGIDGDDFLVLWTIAHLNDPENGVPFPEIKTALEIVEKSFVYFDLSCDGTLERSEIMAALQSSSRSDHAKPSKGAKGQGAGAMLFQVLDLDNSGEITFKEFLLGMRKIVLDEELEEEELLENIRSGGSGNNGAAVGTTGGSSFRKVASNGSASAEREE